MSKYVDIWGFVAGLGLFLFGMYMLEQGLRGLGTRTLKIVLRAGTRSPLRGVFTGAVATAILQSSSLVSMIVLAFVGAGILELRNALGVIFGANLGTTFKGWLVTFVGFTFDLGAFAQPLLAVGALGTVFLPQGKRPYFYANIVLGLALLLMGLDQMKAGFESLAQNVDVSVLQGHAPVVYLIAGALFTAVIQSSSASMMILLSALYSNVIDMHAAAALAIGADLGTTSTVLLGSIKGQPDKRRVALSHFIFNLVTDVIAFMMLPALLWFIANMLVIQDPLYTLVAFHSLFNLVGIVLFLPFVTPFERLLRRLVREHKEGAACEFVSRVSHTVPDAAIEAARQDLRKLLRHALIYVLETFRIRPEGVLPAPALVSAGARVDTHRDGYEYVKAIAGELQAYTYRAQSAATEPEDTREITQISHAVRNLGYATKYVKDVRHNLSDFSDTEKNAIREIYMDFHKQMLDICRRTAAIAWDDPEETGAQHFLELSRDLRGTYEHTIADIYSSSHGAELGSTEIGSLLNVNRALYLASLGLMEGVRVLRELDRTSIMQTPEATLALEAHDVP